MELRIILISSMLGAGAIFDLVAVLTFIQAKIWKNKNIYLVGVSWLLWSFVWYLLACGHIFLDVTFHKIGYIFQIVSTLFLFLYIRYNQSRTIPLKNLATFLIISTAYLYYIINNVEYEIIPGYGLHFLGKIRLMQIIFAIYYNLMTFIWIFKVYKATPIHLKKKMGKPFIVSGFVMNILPVLIYMAASVFIPLGAFPFLVYAVGALLTIFAIHKNPKLIYLLTFEAHMVMIIDKKSSIPISEYRWTNKQLGQRGLNFIISSLNTMSNIAFEDESVKEISIADITIYVLQDEYIYIVLVASKSSNYLLTSLEVFYQSFKNKYTPSSAAENGISSDEWEFVDEMIEEYFEFIPKKIAD